MHRLQISVEKRQYDWLQEHARRLGVSIAEVVRQMVRREAEEDEAGDAETFLALAGTAEDRYPLVNGPPVSANVDLYLAYHELERRCAPAKLG